MIIKDNQKLLDRYLMLCKSKGLTEETVKAFTIDLNLFLKFIGNIKLEEVNHFLCEDFLFYCQNERNNKDQAISRKFTTLNNFFKTIIKKDYVTMMNPFDKLDKPKVRKKQRDHLNEEEVQKIFQYLESKKDLRNLAIFSLLFSSGIRLSELYQLNRHQIDYKTKRFKVMGKGQKERICILDDYAKDNIIKYLDSRDDDLEPLFISRERNRLSKRAIQKMIKDVIKKSGINKNMCTHNLRHSCAMILLQKDMPLNLIQKVLGHNNISTTQIYAHNSMEDVEKFLEDIY